MNNFFNKENFLGLALGFGLLVLGFFLMSRPPVNGVLTLTVAPIILTLTYCIIIPLAIVFSKKSK